ncbi:unnamed protein product [Tenebrio molitor]|nr:unnamed protein product [Tenebrio molitor]
MIFFLFAGRAMTAWTQLFEPGPALVLLIALLVPQTAVAAPLNEHDMTDIEYYPVADSTGCYYNFQHYDEGDRIITNEPCLNCTCHNRMLMCYLRVCPFTKAIGQDCKVEKRADQCCPVITCPEVPVQLLTSSTTQSSTALGHLDAYGCSIDGLFYSDGARVPSDPNKPCELCYCIRNKTACVMQECTLKVEGCKPVYQEGVCCPVRYDCEHPDYNLLETTTRRLITTTTETPTTTLAGPVDCIHNNEIYADGALVIKDKPCEHCYCMRGDIVCAVQECSPTPLDKVNCTALPPKEGQCCPDNYECEHMIEEELTTGYSYTTPPSAGFDEIATTQPSVELKPEEEEGVTSSQTEQPIEITSPPGEESTVPSVGKEGEVAQEPVTILPVEAEKEQPGQLPESPEKEDHEEPVKSGVTPLFDEAAHVTEGAVQETEKPISQEQVTEQPEDIPATVKPEVEIPDQEVNEIPEEHEIVTAGPHVPEHDEIVHPEETEYPTQEHEAGSGEEPHVTETEAKVTETPGVTEGEGTIVPQQPVHVTEQQPTEGQQTEGPQVHVTESEGVVTELPQKPETETEGITEGDLEAPQHVPIDEGEEGEEEVPEKHLTEPAAEQGKETEVPKDVTAAMGHGTTELPHVVGHVTETAPEIGTGLPHEMEAEGTERQQGEVTEIPHEVITQGQVEEGEVTEIPQVPVTEEVHEISKIPSDHVPKGEEGQGEITEIPQYVTEGAAEEGKATEMPRVTEAQTSKAELPQTGVTEGESTELPQQHVTEAGEKSTEMPQEPIVVDESTGVPQEQGPEEGTELPHKHVPEITELPGEHVTQGQETELPKEHVTNIPVTEGEITEQPTQAETGTELPKDHTEGEGTELPEGHVTQVPISEAESTELPKEQEGEVPKEQMTQLPVTDEESTELPKEQEEIPKEHMTQLPVTEEESTELPKEEEKAEGTELPKEHMTQAPITEDESTGLPKEQEKEQIPGEHLTQVPMVEEGTEGPKEEEKGTELPKEHVTFVPEIGGEGTELPQEQTTGEGTKLPDEHVTEGVIAGEGETKLPPEHVTHEYVAQGTEQPHEITEKPVEEGTELVKEHITQGPITGEEGTELPKEHITQGPITGEEGTELPKEHITQGPITGEEGTELPKEHITQGPITSEEGTELPKEHITGGPVTAEEGTELPSEQGTGAPQEQGTELPQEQFTDKPLEGEIPKEHITQVPVLGGEATESPFEHVTKDQAHEGTELPKEHITATPEIGGEGTKPPQEYMTEAPVTKLPEEYITEGAVEEGKVTELPQAHVTVGEAEEGQTTELPKEHVPEEGQTTEHPREPQVTEGQISEKPEYITESKLDETTKYAEEPTPVEGEIPDQYPVEHDHLPEVPEQETEKTVPHVPEGQTESGETATLTPGEAEKPQEATMKPSPALEGQTEESVTKESTERMPSGEGEGTTVKYVPEQEEGKSTELPHVTEGSGEEISTKMPEDLQQVTEKQPTGEEKETEIPEQVTPAIPQVPSEEHSEKPTEIKPDEAVTTNIIEHGEGTTYAYTERVQPQEVTEEPLYPHAHDDLEHPAAEEGEEEEGERGVPGEGSCLVDGQTYKNNSNVPPINHCQVSCKCVSSILQCESVTCTPPPSNLQHCMPVYQGPDSCCPTYSCAIPGVTSMESDSHKMETTTKETLPGSIGVDIIIPSEEGTVRPEGTTVSAREETELPEYVLPEEHVPYVPHLPEGHVPEQTTKLPEGAATEGYVTITKPAEHVPAHTEMPVEVITSAEGEIDTVPTIQEGSTEVSVTEVGQEQSTEKHLEPQPVTEIAPEQVTEKHLEQQPATEIIGQEQPELQPATEIGQEGTTLKPGTEVEGEPETHVTEHPEGIEHDEGHPQIPDEGENEIEDHIVAELPVTSAEAEKAPHTVIPSKFPEEPVSTEVPEKEEMVTHPGDIAAEVLPDVTEVVTEAEVPSKPESVTERQPDVPEQVTEGIKVEGPETATDVTKEHATEGITMKPGEVSEVATEGVTTKPEEIPEIATEAEKESPVHVTDGVPGEHITESIPEAATEGVKLPSVPETTPEIVTEGVKVDVTEGVTETGTEAVEVVVPELTTVPGEEEHKLTTEGVKEHIPEEVTEGEGVKEVMPTESAEPEKPIVPEGVTEEAVIDAEKEGPESVTGAPSPKEPEIPVTEGMKEQEPHFDEAAVPHEETSPEYKPEEHMTEPHVIDERPEGTTLPTEMVTEGKLPEQGTEGGILATITEPSATAKMPESISHVTEKPEEGQLPTHDESATAGPEVTETVPSKEGKPTEHVPSGEPEVSTEHVYHPMPAFGEEEGGERIQPDISEPHDGDVTTAVPEHVPAISEKTDIIETAKPAVTEPSKHIPGEGIEGTTAHPEIVPEMGEEGGITESATKPEQVPGAEQPEGTTALPEHVPGISEEGGITEPAIKPEHVPGEEPEGTTALPEHVPGVSEGVVTEPATKPEQVSGAEPEGTTALPEHVPGVSEEGVVTEPATKLEQIPGTEPEGTTVLPEHVPGISEEGGITEPATKPEHVPGAEPEGTTALPEHVPGVSEGVVTEPATKPEHVPGEEPEGTTALPEHVPGVSEEGIVTEPSIKPEQVPGAEPEGTTALPEHVPGVSEDGGITQSSTKPEQVPGAEQPKGTTALPEHIPGVGEDGGITEPATKPEQVPGAEPEGTTALPEHVPGVSEEGVTEPGTKPEQVPGAEPEGTTALPEHVPGVSEDGGIKPEQVPGAEQPEGTTALPEHIPGVSEEGGITEPATKPEQVPSTESEGTTVLPEHVPAVSEEGGITESATKPEQTAGGEPEGTTALPEHVPVVSEEGGVTEPPKAGVTVPGETSTEIVPTEKAVEGVTETGEKVTPSQGLPEHVPGTMQPEGEATTLRPSYLPEGSTPSDGVSESVEVTEKEGEPSIQVTPESTTAAEAVSEEAKVTTKRPFIYIPPIYEPEQVPAQDEVTETEEEFAHTTLGYVPEGSTVAGVPEHAASSEQPEHVPGTPQPEHVSSTSRPEYEGTTLTPGVTEGEVVETVPGATTGIPPAEIPEGTEKQVPVTEQESVVTVTAQYVTETPEQGTQKPEGQATEGVPEVATEIPSRVGEGDHTTLKPVEVTQRKGEEQVTEGVTQQPTVPAGEMEAKPTELPAQKPEEGVTEYVSAISTEKSFEVPTTQPPTEGVTQARPAIPGEGQEPPVEETSQTALEGKPEEAFTSPTVTTTQTSKPFTSGPSEEESTKKGMAGELSTSAPSSVLTSSTTLPPQHTVPEEPDYQTPEEDYGEEDQSAFGPGTCRYGGKVYVSAQQIPRDDPCDFCFCFRSDIICLQQSCPPPIPRCHEEPIRGFCCPRYECPVSMATSVNVTTTTTTTTTTLPPHFLSHAYKGKAIRSGCQIRNKAYNVGEEIKSASGPCLHCTCGGDGQMKCDPKACSPEPMLRQMIAAAESRRRR